MDKTDTRIPKKNLSLYPLKFKDAVPALLKVKPQPKKGKKQKGFRAASPFLVSDDRPLHGGLRFHPHMRI